MLQYQTIREPPAIEVSPRSRARWRRRRQPLWDASLLLAVCALDKAAGHDRNFDVTCDRRARRTEAIQFSLAPVCGGRSVERGQGGARMGDAQSCLACDSKRASTTREVRKAVPSHRYSCLRGARRCKTKCYTCGREWRVRMGPARFAAFKSFSNVEENSRSYHSQMDA